jgi:hypothetical protein
MPNVFEFSVDDERMNAFTNILSQTKSKNSKIYKKGSSLGAIQPSKISPYEAKSVQVFSKSAPVFHSLPQISKNHFKISGSRLFISKQEIFSCEIHSKSRPYPLPF